MDKRESSIILPEIDDRDKLRYFNVNQFDEPSQPLLYIGSMCLVGFMYLYDKIIHF